MLFSEIEFFIFFPVLFGLMLVVRDNGRRKALLLAASLYFYARWDLRFMFLLAFSALIDYFLALKAEDAADPVVKKRLIALGVALNLGLLAIFKYCDFFILSFNALLPAGMELGTLAWLLPVGLSFRTFQKIAYLVEVGRGRFKACRSIPDFLLYVSFFPQLAAGPIVRPAQFLPQLEKAPAFDADLVFAGLARFVTGLFKKCFIADNLGMFVDHAFNDAPVFNGATLWLAVLAYTVEIYCDFSGYSDMAIGSARMLGYELPENFRLPYLSTSLREFWRRWHITLSDWLRDYLYVGLGGNRVGPVRTYVNLFLTMVLGGLWHGASWNFVLWGAVHGGVLALSRLRENLRLPAPPAFLGWALTFVVVALAWTPFKAADFAGTLVMFERMFTFAPGIAWTPPFVVFGIALVALRHAARAASLDARLKWRRDSVWSAAALCTMLWLVVLFFPKNFQPFVYMQF